MSVKYQKHADENMYIVIMGNLYYGSYTLCMMGALKLKADLVFKKV